MTLFFNKIMTIVRKKMKISGEIENIDRKKRERNLIMRGKNGGGKKIQGGKN